MKTLIEWFAHNPIAGNLLIVILWVGGWFGLQSMRQEIIPQMALNMLVVRVNDLGSSPTEMETQILKPMELALADLPQIKQLRSFTNGSTASLTLELQESSDAQAVQQKVAARLQRIPEWPDGVEKPDVIIAAVERDYVAKLVLFGDTDTATLRRLAQQTKDDLLNEQIITQVTIGGVAPAEVMIEVSAAMLARYQLSFAELSSVLKQQLTNVVSGQVAYAGGQSAILARGEIAELRDLEQVVVRSGPDGSELLLKDIALIQPSTISQQLRFFYQGKPAIYLEVYRQGTQNIITVSDALAQVAKRLNAHLPAQIKAAIWQDMARHYKSRIQLMISDAWMSLLLVFLPLWLILKWRLAFWVCWDIPTAFLGAVAVLPWLGVSFNMVSLFAFIMVMGVVVDDSIVVGENIHDHQLRFGPGIKSAVSGTYEVAVPVVLSSFATIAMFAPLYFLPGAEGRMIRDIPVVVVVILLLSLLEALFILPGHVVGSDKPGVWSRLKNWLPLTSVSRSNERKLKKKNTQLNALPADKPSWALRAIEYFSGHIYVPFLRHCLRWRYVVLAGFIASGLLAAGLLGGQWIKLRLLSEVATDEISAQLKLPTGTDITTTQAITEQLYASAAQLEQQLNQQHPEPIVNSISMMYGQEGNHLGSVLMELKPSENRLISNEQIVALWRQQLPESLKPYNISFVTTLLQSGPDIDIQLLAKNPEALQRAVTALKQQLLSYTGVYEIEDDAESQQAEVELTLTPRGQQLGLHTAGLAQQVRQAFQGLPLLTVIQQGEPWVVRLGYPQAEQQLGYLEQLPVTLSSGQQVPLQQIAKVELIEGPQAISRVQFKRSLRVKARVDASVVSAVTIQQRLQQDFFSKLAEQHPEVTWQRAGLQESQQEFLQKLFKGSLLGLLAMYAIMALLFRSYGQPLMILTAVPFGWVGALLGHAWMGLPCTLMSLVGMTAVSGIVVNHNLVLVDCVNRFRRQGMPAYAAILAAARSRFCSIFLTSFTTIIGLMPLVAQTSVQAQFLVPMAASLAFGVSFATLVTWIFVPCLYAILQDMRLFGSAPLRSSNEQSAGLL